MMKRNNWIFILGFSVLILMLSAAGAFADYPLLTTVTYSADPSCLEYNGTIYSYWSNDDNNNGSYSMHQITCLSSTDLKHWTNNGQVFQVPSGASWASNCWAPAVVYRNGYFWMYFGNGGSGIGVAKSTSPTGPFTDAKGSALITPSMPNCNVTYCFDPGVLVDDDGRIYMFFGGGGPGNARGIEIGSDMTSTVGTAVTINAPRFFEDSWIHKYNGNYYYSYSSDFSQGAATIEYMMSTSPLTGYVHKGTAMPNPPDNSGNNNHHSIFQYQGNWYIGYHNRYVAIQQGIDTTYKRNACMDQLYYNADGTIKQVACTKSGMPQLGTPGPTVEPTAVPTVGPTPVPGTISIACGSSSAVGDFQPDQYYSGGTAFNNTNTVDVSQITSNPPPAALFNNERYGAMSYTIPGFTAGSSYTVMLYFAETYLTSSGSRVFNVSINGTTVLSNFDIYASAGGQNKAIARPFTTTADSSGQIVIQLTAVTENPKINGISINPGSNGGILGDVNGSGTVDIVDALLIAQYYVGLNPSGFVAANADVNCSGGIDIVDALLVAQYYVGLIASFPC
jgi:arabinoxylan arabinofuranohydrolase